MSQGSDDQVRAIELAEWLGVSERAVADYAHRGIITRSGRAVFPLKESIRAVCDHFREAASARGASSGGLTAQRERIAREQADKLEMQNAAARRELLPAKVVADGWTSILRMVRSRMLASPSRIQQQLGHLSAHDVAVIDRELRDALVDMSNDGL